MMQNRAAYPGRTCWDRLCAPTCAVVCNRVPRPWPEPGEVTMGGGRQTSSERAASGGKEAVPQRALVVEDNELARKQLVQLLRAEPGLQVEAVADGAEAWKLLQKGGFSLAVTDL